jgi:AAA+ ATPase superfamily predicted ATPase
MPLKFKNVAEFFEQDLEEIIRFYSITGGIPFYIVELDNKKTAIENIYEYILKKGSVFYDEGEILLKSELKDSSTYFSILKTMAEGITKQVNIANKIGFKASSLPKYLSTLIRLGFINKISLATEKEKSKKVRYEIKDNFINFWFKFVEPAKKYVEENNQEEIRNLLGLFELYISKKFENLVREELFLEINKKMKILEAKKIGKWWGYKRENNERKGVEIDLVALNLDKKEILFGECKWEDKVNAMQIINQLAEKAKQVEWPNKEEKEKRKEFFAVFAKTFSKKITEFEGKKVFCFDLKDIEKVLRAKQRL